MGVKNRISEISKNHYGTLMKIIEYISATNIVVEFQDEYHYITNSNYSHFKKGNIKNPYDKTVYKIGYLGCNPKEINKDIYDIWSAMLKRCYSNNNSYYYRYKNCTVDNSWYNYSVFYKWYKENHYVINDEIMCLDKDILYKNNKIYSSETCIIVPQNINKLFTKNNKMRGKYIIGVTKTINKYKAQCNDGNGTIVFLGNYSTEYEAFCTYKTYKEQLIKNIADKYKSEIPIKLYNALYKYEVDISD